MRVLICSSEFPPGPGGIGTHAYQLTEQLRRLGREVRVITNQDHTSEQSIAEFNPRQAFPIVRMRRFGAPPLKLAYRCALVRKWLASWKPDIVIATGDREILAVATAMTRVPWICIEHGRRPSAAWERSLKRWAFGRANAVVAVSEYSRTRLLAMGVRPRASFVIPNGADPERFAIATPSPKPAVLAELGLRTGSLILSVGHVSDRKGQDIMIRAMPAVVRAVPDAHYVIVGKPTKTPEFRALAEQLGVASHVHFVGQVDAKQLDRLLGACDVHVMTSRHTVDEFEGYGIAVVEAALCGKPSVVSGESGLAEAIVDGETGLVAKLADEADTARAVIELLADDTRRLAMGDAAHRRARTEQTWQHRIKRYDDLLAQVASS